MKKLSLLEQISILMKIINSSSLFIIAFIIGVILIAMMILDLKTNKKIKEKFFIVIWISVMIFIGIRYCNYLLKLSDNLVEEVFTAIYFPNLAIYTVLIISINIALITALIKKKMTYSYKVINTLTTIIMDFLFILILETIIKNKIDVYKTLTVYSNGDLLTLIQLSSATYTAWLFGIGFIHVVNSTIKKPIIEDKKIKETLNDKIEISINYNAPISNAFIENNKPLRLANDEEVDYTNIFFQNPIDNTKEQLSNIIVKEKENNSFNISKKEETNNFIKEKTLNIENKHFIEKNSELFNINEKEESHISPIISEIKNINEQDIIKENDKLFTIEPQVKNTSKKFKRSIFKKSVKKDNQLDILKCETYRVPLFDSLNDDALLNCIVPLKNDNDKVIINKISTTIENKPSINSILNITIKLDGKDLLEKFNRGEKLNIEQYKVLKEYIMTKQGV